MKNTVFYAFLILLSGCDSPSEPPKINFGQIDGRDVTPYFISNENGMTACILDYGAIVQSLTAPDREGRFADVVLGHDKVEGYSPYPGFPYFGCIVGRYANRIAKAQFKLDGHTFQLAANNNGNSLHGGVRGFDKVFWTVAKKERDLIVLKYRSKDGEEGYPGNLDVKVQYLLGMDNSLQIIYEATTDKSTPVNLTNHSYFNLSGGRSPDILGHVLTIVADKYTEVDSLLIPTGRLVPTKGTVMDFSEGKPIGQDMAQVPGGYDHNYVITVPKDSSILPSHIPPFHAVATLHDPVSGRTMKMLSSEPGVQFYSGNFLDGTIRGKGGTAYGKYAGLCLEAQHFPDSPNQPSFPNTILKPDEVYRQITIYLFSLK